MTGPEEPKSARKVAAAILGTLILGAIGSGVWDRIGGPIFDLGSKLLIDGLDFVTRSYKDSIYREASYGFQETSSSFIHQQFLGILPFMYFFIALKHPWLREKLPPNNKSRTKEFLRSSKGFYLISFITVSVFVSCLISMTRLTYIRAVITYAQTTIQRIAPHIDDQTEERLLAQFRSVRNASDYYAFHDEIQNLLKSLNMEDYGTKPL
jgi:hypothetical protein